jgi:glycosyltransferase involved in cell wall biosynthesis
MFGGSTAEREAKPRARFSVAMCTYNGAAFLPAQLESIAKQTRLPDELIVCDDSSSDETTNIVERFAVAAPFPVKLYINEKNLGVIKNFEKAIGLCTGDIIALSDQDDVWYSHKLKLLEDTFQSKPDVGLVFSDADMVDEHLRPLGHRLWQFTFSKKKRRLVRQGRTLEALIQRNFVTGATMAFRSDFNEMILPIPTDTVLIHDGWIALVIAALAEISFISRPLIMYRQHRNQHTGVEIGSSRLRELFGNTHARSHSEFLNDVTNIYLSEFKPLEHHLERIVLLCREVYGEKYAARIKAGISNQNRLIEHYRKRAWITSASKSNRIPFIFKELLSSRYHHFSSGFYSAARDLVL